MFLANTAYLCNAPKAFRMKKAEKRILIAWLLFVTFMPLLVVKSLHNHADSEHPSACHSDHRQTSNPYDSCAICHFTVSPFIQAEILHFDFRLTLTPCEPVVYLSKISFALSYSPCLRAPPVLA